MTFLNARKYLLIFENINPTSCCSKRPIVLALMKRCGLINGGGKCFYSHGSGTARGVLIGFSRAFAGIAKIDHLFSDLKGRIVIVKVEIPQVIEFLVVNIYAPNEDDVGFFEDLTREIHKCEVYSKILGGDFNVPLNPDIDQDSATTSHHKSRTYLNELIVEEELWDIWRTRNLDSVMYTWRRYHPVLTQSRLDYFLVSKDIASCTTDVGSVPGYRTDHSSIFITISTITDCRGRGLWKINNDLLKDHEFITSVNTVLDQTLDEFCNCNPAIKWELVKIRVSEFAIDYANKKAAQRKELTSTLKAKIHQLTNDIAINKNQNSIDQLEQCSIELEEINRKKAQSVIFRSKARWVEDGERNSKYFFNLEKANFRHKTVHQLITEDNIVTSNVDEILLECKKFYGNLYRLKNSTSFSLINNYGKTVSNEDNIALSRTLSVEEIGNALKTFKDNKSPGCDGLTAEVYKIFWPKIKQTLFEYYRYCIDQGFLSISARRGVLTLIPKKDKNLLELNNWRPLTMLNMDYKIFSKVLALRLQPILPKIISEHQTGFMQGRNIMDNIRKTIEIVSYVRQRQWQKIIFSLDFHKCFDSCKVSALLGSLRFFGIAEDYIDLVAILFSHFQLTVQNNGNISEWFDQQVGCRQGCCYSPLAFLVLAETLSLHLTNNPRIQGINIEEFRQLISQFADDTDLFLDYEIETIQEVTNTLNTMESQLGLKINPSKSVIYRLGALHNTENMLHSDLNVPWTNNPFTVLGITIAETITERVELNLVPLIEKTRSVLKVWAQRSLTLMGRVLICTTLIESLFVYKFSVIEMASLDYYHKLQSLITEFVWKSGRSRLSNKTLCAPKFQGGLRLPNIHLKHKALLLQWIYHVESRPFFKMRMYESLVPEIGTYIWYVNISPADVKKIIPNRSFWRDIAVIWAEYHFHYPDTAAQVLKQSLWLNSHIRVEGKLKWSNTAIQAEVKFVSDIWTPNGFLSYVQFVNKYPNAGLSWLEYYQMCDAIPLGWRTLLKRNPNSVNAPHDIDKFVNSKNGAKTFYTALVENECNLGKQLATWNRRYSWGITLEVFHKKISAINSCTILTQLRDFQYRLLTNLLVFNCHLFAWKIKPTDTCSFCKKAPENTKHFLTECEVTQNFWKEVEHLCTENGLAVENVLTKYNIVFGWANKPNHIINLIIVLGKQYLYSSRCMGKLPCIKQFKVKLKTMYDVEWYIAKKNNKLNKHYRKWTPLNIGTKSNYATEADLQSYIDNHFV